MWVFVVKCFPLQHSACCLPLSVVVRSVKQGLGDAQSGIRKKWGPTEGVRMEGMGACMYGSLCVLSRAKGPQLRGGGVVVLWNYSYSLNAERKALDRLRKPHIENACTENTHAYTQTCSDNPGSSARDPSICCCSQSCEKPSFAKAFSGSPRI